MFRRKGQWLGQGKPVARMCVALILLACGFAVNGQQNDPIRIGYMAPLTGANAQAGQDMVDGFMMALDEVGSTVAGRTLKVIVEDDAGDPALALTKARKLITNDKIDVMTGVAVGNVCGAVAPYINGQKIPFVTQAASPDDLTQRQRLAYLIRVSHSGSQFTMPFGEWAYKNGSKKVVTIGNDYSFCHEGVAGFQMAFEESGGQVVQKIWVPMNTLDFAPFISQIDRNADTVFAHIIGNYALRFVKQYEEAGLKGKLKLLGGNILTDESILPQMGNEALDIVSTRLWSGALTTPAAKKFIAAYEKKYNRTPSWYSVCQYSGALFLIEGIKGVNGNVESKDAFLKAILKSKLPNSPRGALSFDEYNNCITDVFICKVEKVNGELQNTVIQTLSQVGQFWKYKPEDILKNPPMGREYPPCKNCSK